jgi:polyhydroxyalkanoate synthase subunit PhaE
MMPFIVAGARPSARELLEPLFQLGQSYLQMTAPAAGAGLQDPAIADQWLSHLHSAIHAVNPADGAVALWNLPLDTWRWASSLPLLSDFLEGIKRERVAHTSAELRGRLDRLLAVPAVGYAREVQDQYQRLMRSMLGYLEALEEYNTLFVRLADRSAEHVRKKINEVNPPPDSLRALYDLWVDACEEVYAEDAMSDEYAAVHGRVVNALVAVKRQYSPLVDGFLEAMNIPTRREIDTMHRRLYQLRRQNHGLRAELERVRVISAGHAVGASASAPVRTKKQSKAKKQSRVRPT